LRVELYNTLSLLLLKTKRDECRTILCELDKYVKLLHGTQSIKPELLLLYTACVREVYHYLYKMRQISREGGFDPDVLKHINDIFTTIMKEHDAD